MTPKVIAAVGYARRSTDMQERSIPDQQAHVERYAMEHGFRVLRWYVDDAISGTSAKGREAFERLLRDAERGGDFEAVLCYDLSRFSRGGTNETGFYLHRLTQAGVRAIFTAEGIPEGDEGELLQGVKSWQARQYSVKLSRDTIRGMLSHVLEKRCAPGGLPPYGYDKQHLTASGQVLRTFRWLPDGRKQELGPDGKLVRVLESGERVEKAKSDLVRYVPSLPERVAIVRRIFGQCIKGYGYLHNASHLNAEGIPNVSGGLWSQTDIQRILANPAYRGATAWNRATNGKIHSLDRDGKLSLRKDHKYRLHAPDQWIVVENTHEPLVPPEVFAQARQALSKRRWQGGQARQAGRSLLAGLITCAHCKHVFRHLRARLRNGREERDRAYVDGGYQKCGRAKCLYTLLPAAALEAWVVEQVREAILGDHAGTAQAIAAFVREALAAQEAPDRAAGLDRELEALNRRIRATVAMLADPSLENLDELRAALVDLKAKRDTLQKRAGEPTPVKAPRLTTSELRAWAQHQLDTLDHIRDGTAPSLEARQLMQAYVMRIEIDPHKKQGALYLPADALGCFTRGLSTGIAYGDQFA